MPARGGGFRAILGAAAGALSDVFGPPLRGLVLGAVALAAALLGGLTWAAITFLIPLIPDLTGRFHGVTLDTVSAGAEIFASIGAVVIAIILWPGVSLIVGGLFFEVAAERVERARFPADPRGRAITVGEALGNTLKIALPAIGLNLIAAPLLFIPGVNLAAFLTLNALLMSREYFSIAALRFRPWAQVRALRKAHGRTIFVAGLTCAVLLLVPIVNLLTPLYGAALMVRLNKALTQSPDPGPAKG